MSLFRGKNAKSLFTAILFLFFLCLLLELGMAWERNQSAWQLLLARDQAAASTLLRLGVPEETIAQALSGTEASPEGIRLLNRLGLAPHTNLWLFADLSVYGRYSFAFSLLIPVCIFALLFAVIIRFLRRQEHLYLQAVNTVLAYTEGSFDTPLPQSGEGSLYRLFGSINHMAAALKAGQEAEHRSREFLKNTISDISHQLKTPLAALSMYNEIMLNEPEHADTVRTFAEKSGASIERMKSLTLSLLKIARLDAGAITFQKTVCPVSELLNAALNPLAWRLLPEKKNVILPPFCDETLFCDPLWTAEALGNILKNALDHTGENGRIEICVEQTPLEIRICVSDNGEGISPEDLHHIFKRFYRSSSASRTSGAGLGLPLAKGILEGQEGNLFVTSRPGLGASFTLCLPNPSVLQNCKAEFT